MTKPTATRTVRVAFGDGRSYDVVIGSGVLVQVQHRLGDLVGRSRDWFLIRDSGVPAVHKATLVTGKQVPHPGYNEVIWTPSEADKNLTQAATFIDQMARARFERGNPVIALGGGITGDIAGFAASVYQRGVPWINCPTTLLAMVDASVGGKTGVNLSVSGSTGPATYKNLVGAFHQPILVVADVATLASLPDRIFRSGLAECIKHAMISADWGDPTLLDWTRANLDSILKRDEGVLIELITRNIAIKAAVVAADEHESGEGPGGGRMALNLGHTFGHAVETLPGLCLDGDHSGGPLQHGEAVGLGLIAAATCAQAAGMCQPGLSEEVASLLTSCGLPTRVSGLPDNATLLSRMLHDKKVQGSKLRLIVPTERGRVTVVTDPKLPHVYAGLAAIRAS